MRIALPYHHAYLQAEVPDDRVFAVLQPKLPAEAFISQEQIVEKALAPACRQCSFARAGEGGLAGAHDLQ